MLESYKKLYEQVANQIPNWKKMSKNDLINGYIDNEHDKKKADAYMSAIVCRYWNAISKYYSTSHNSVSIEDCYDWLIRSILYAIQRRPWRDPKNKLYTDPNGPDKVVNRVIISTRLGFFQSSNTHKRKCNFGNTSVEHLIEELGDAAPLPISDDLHDAEGNLDIQALILNAFKNKEYLLAFMVDGIVNYDPFDRERGEDGFLYTQFNIRKLSRHLRALDGVYCKNFSNFFKLKEDDVRNAVQDCKNLSRTRMYTAIKKNLKLLKRSKAISLGE